MKSYMFILGRDPELSFLEIIEYFKAHNMHLEIEHAEGIILIVKAYTFNPKKLIKHLGGTQKIGLVIEDIDKISLYNGKSNKMKYAISVYGEQDKDLEDYIKLRLKKEKLKAYKKNSSRKYEYLSPSESLKVIENGFELLSYDGIVAVTEAVFNPKEHEKRDIKRPVTRPLEAVSIRLAKFLVNLAGVKEKSWILDPFCGVGTVLGEGLLNGYNMIGIDLNTRNITACYKNLKWLRKQYNFDGEYQLYCWDAAKLSRKVKKVDAVVSEPFMGVLLDHLPTRAEAIKIRAPLTRLYNNMLSELNGRVKKRIIFVVPSWRVRDSKNNVRIEFGKMAQRNGFKAVMEMHGIKLPYVYIAGKSRLEREIWVLEPM